MDEAGQDSSLPMPGGEEYLLSETIIDGERASLYTLPSNSCGVDGLRGTGGAILNGVAYMLSILPCVLLETSSIELTLANRL